MKRTFHFFFLMLAALYSQAQNKVEVLINGEPQQISNEAIRVMGNDKIEIKIYYENKSLKNNIIDSIYSEGCGTYSKNKKGLFVPKDYQQQQQSATRAVEQKYVINKSLKPILKNECIYFVFYVNEVTACPGRNFSLVFMFNYRLSPLKKFKGFVNRYVFYNKL